MGSGRTYDQNVGGTGAGGRNTDDYDQSSGGGKDSMAGKLMEKAGGMFKNEKMMEKVRQGLAECDPYPNQKTGSAETCGSKRRRLWQLWDRLR